LVARSKIEKLSARIYRLIERRHPRRFIIVFRERGEDCDEALARHLRARPDDQSGTDFIFVSWKIPNITPQGSIS
jgi:hypothetical protein